MTRRILQLGLILAGAGLLLPGCELLQHTGHSRTEDRAPRAAESTSDADASGESAEAKKFFKSSRLSGAMSSEGREIERDLGIP
jgi:hypothetical protein